MSNTSKDKIYNPNTKRFIKNTSTNRNKIDRLNTLIVKDLISKKVKSNDINNSAVRNVFKRIKEREGLYPPPMGPLIHPEFIKNHETNINRNKKREELKNNYIDMYTYLYEERIPKIIKKEVPLSVMEKNDLLELSKIITKELKDIDLIDKDDINEIKIMENQLKEVFKNNEVIDDQPTKKHIGSWYIEPLRYDNRLHLLNLYNLIKSEKSFMQGSIKLNTFEALVTSSVIIRLVLGKRYIDELIRLKIFSHDDLYNNMFESENIFDELQELHKKYIEAYKKTKKNNNSS
jgi:hypothetical protein